MARVESPALQKRREGIGTFASLHHIDFRYLWIGNLFNNAGLWIQQVTISWLIWDLSRSANLVGIAAGLRFVPFLFMGPLGGIAADRMDRRRLLMMTQTVMAAAAVLFAGVVALDWVRVWHALVFSFVMGCGFTVSAPVRQSLLANTVPLEELGNAIAINATASNAGHIIGPAIGGVLIVTLGVSGNFLLQAGLYLCMVAVIIPMKVPYRDTTSVRRASAFSSLKEGIRYVWSNKTMFVLIMLSFIPSLFLMPVLQVMPAFTEDVLHAKADIYGYLITAFGVGAFLATLTMASFGSVIRSGLLGLVVLVTGAICVIFLSQSNVPWIAFLLLMAIGFSIMTFKVNNNTLVQTLAPDSLRGRVMSIYNMDHVLEPLAYFILGVFADLFSAPTAMAATGILCLLIMGVLLVCVKQVQDLLKL